jgi:hypothetical protein
VSEAVAASADAPEDPRLSRYWALYRTVADEWPRRLRRAILVACLAALLAVFALGASVLPNEMSSDLLLGYLVFLAFFGVVLALSLLYQTGGDYRRALAVGEFARQNAWREWAESVGQERPPLSADEAAAWLASSRTGPESPGHRAYAHLLTGDVDAARALLSRYPSGTDHERFDRDADQWVMDFMDGRADPLEPLEQAAAAIEDPDRRAVALVGTAHRRAMAANAAGGDWMTPMAQAYPLVAGRVTEDWRVGAIARVWTIGMVAASLMIGGALLFSRLTGVWI